MGNWLQQAVALKEKLREAENRSHYYQSLQRAFDFLQQNFSTKISAQQAARMAAMSRSNFARRFKLATGLTFHRFLVLRSVLRAIQLIENSDRSLSEIAVTAGFENLWALEYNFKRHVGCEPSEYRELVRAKV